MPFFIERTSGTPKTGSRVLRLSLALIVALVLMVQSPSPTRATVSGVEGKIAYVSDQDGNHEIYTMEPDGSGKTNITTHPASDVSPTWSPDGRSIAFVSDRSGARAIWIMNADGSAPRLLTSGEAPGWSPDGTQIAFTDPRDSDEVVPAASVWMIGVDGTGLRRLTRPEVDPVYRAELASGAYVYLPIHDANPTWFPDGSSILFHRYRAPHITYDLMSLHIASGVISTLPATRTLGHGDIAPDGDRVVYGVMSGMHNTSIGIFDISSSVSSILPNSYGFGGTASWSPEGDRIVRSFNPGGLNADVVVVDLSGTVTTLAGHAGAYESSPAWQPLNPYPVGLVDPATGLWRLRNAEGVVSTFYYGNPGDYPFTGDWNCDGEATPGLYRQSDGYVYLRNSNTQGVADIRFFFGNPGDIPLAGDFSGDGCDTVAIYRPAEAMIYVINELGSDDQGLGAADYSYSFGNPGDKPFVGDFDGDGIDTVGLHRESTGRVYYRNSNTTGIADNDYIYGAPGDRIIADDWNGDGLQSPAVYRPSTRTHYFRFTNTPGFADAQFIWGQPGWIPVPVR